MDTGTSLLLTLLTTDETNETAITASAIHPDLPQGIDDAVQININTVVNSIRPRGKRNLIKDMARKELSETLYSIIHKAYDESKQNPQQDQQHPLLHDAISIALAQTIREASTREATREVSESDRKILMLRDTLRKKVIEALTPKSW